MFVYLRLNKFPNERTKDRRTDKMQHSEQGENMYGLEKGQVNEEWLVLNFKLVEFVTSFWSKNMCGRNEDLGFSRKCTSLSNCHTKYAQLETEMYYVRRMEHSNQDEGMQMEHISVQFVAHENMCVSHCWQWQQQEQQRQRWMVVIVFGGCCVSTIIIWRTILSPRKGMA